MPSADEKNEREHFPWEDPTNITGDPIPTPAATEQNLEDTGEINVPPDLAAGAEQENLNIEPEKENDSRRFLLTPPPQTVPEEDYSRPKRDTLIDSPPEMAPEEPVQRFDALAGTPAAIQQPDIAEHTPRPAEIIEEKPLQPEALQHDFCISQKESEQVMDLDGALKLGIIGAKQTGKSYLFQGMVYRAMAPDRSGAMSRFLKGGRIDLLKTEVEDTKVFELTLQEFAKQYAEWDRLHATQIEQQIWYKLRLQYKCGLFGMQRKAMDIEFLDASGEALETFDVDSSEMGSLWEQAYLHARVVVFCLPMWAVFNNGLSQQELKHMKGHLENFDKVAQKFNTLREKHGVDQPVRCVLALTMADDPRVSMTQLQDRWILSLLDEETRHRGRSVMWHHLAQVRTSRGLNRYLESARQISEVLNEACLAHEDGRIQSIPGRLNFGAGRPWILPVSAIHGGKLTEVERTGIVPQLPPMPVHVELPLLIAVCETYNAMM